MSLLYPNNLLNSTLHRIIPAKFPSPLCGCGNDIQTGHHILFQCNRVSKELKSEAYDTLERIVGEEEAAIDNSIIILKASRNKKFVELLAEIVQKQANNLNTSVDIQLL